MTNEKFINSQIYPYTVLEQCCRTDCQNDAPQYRAQSLHPTWGHSSQDQSRACANCRNGRVGKHRDATVDPIRELWHAPDPADESQEPGHHGVAAKNKNNSPTERRACSDGLRCERGLANAVGKMRGGRDPWIVGHSYAL